MKASHQFKVLCLMLTLVCVLGFTVWSTVALEEEITVEKEGAVPTPVPQQDQPKVTTKNEEVPSQPPTTELKEKNDGPDWLSNNRKQLKNLMKEMRQYQFGNDLFENDWTSRFPSKFLSKNSLLDNFFGNNDDFFSNSFNQMKRSMNNMFKRSLLPSIFEDHQWWEDWSNTINSMKSSPQQQVLSDSQPSGEKKKDETQMVPEQRKKREPIASHVKTTSEGDNMMSIDVTNIPRDLFEKKDIEVKVQENALGDMITIRGEKKTENGHFEFSKSYRFPKGSVDIEKVKAVLSDSGSLSVSIPRIDETPQKDRVKMIAVE